MRLNYISPETEIYGVAVQSNILSNVEDLNMKIYGQGSGEDTDDFWD